MNKNSSLIAVLLLVTAGNMYGMKNDETFPFSSLPKELQQEITVIFLNNEINRLPAEGESLKIAAQKINGLATVNKAFNTAINQPSFCLKLIKGFAKKFNCSDEDAAKALDLKAAKDRLAIQDKLQSAIGIGYNPRRVTDVLALIHKGDADLNFTMNNPNKDDLRYYTPLIKTMRSGRLYSQQIVIIKKLIQSGANPTLSCDGFTPLAYVTKWYPRKADIIKILKDATK